MSGGSVTRVSYKRKPGFLERVGQSFAGCLVGIGLFIASFYVLYYNEGRSVAVTEMLSKGLKMVVPFEGDIQQSNNMLVYVSGPLQSEILSDPEYPVAIPCVRLSRIVEMYQWVEHSEVKEIDEGNDIRKESVYSYNTEWSSIFHKSRSFAEEFGHRNPDVLRVTNQNLVSKAVSIHGLELSSSAVGKIYWFNDLTILPEPPQQSDMKKHGKYYYHAKDPTGPEVGDIRISFQYAGIGGNTKIGAQDQISVIAKQFGGRLMPYSMPGGQSLELLHKGNKSPQEIFKIEQDSNSASTWLLRFIGWFMMFIGLSLMTRIVVTIVDWIPFVRSIVTASVTMFNLSTSVFLSLITIAFSWFWSRPVLSGTLFLVSVVPWYLSKMKANSYHSYYSR